MPSQLTYPGVYVEELPSGTRTITSVSTSVTAFVGRCAKGPVNEPVLITSFAEFERIFGGLWKESKLGFAVKDFYINGGTQAIIVRLTDETAVEATFNIDTGKIILEAANPGKWGNTLKATISHDSTSPEAAVIAQNLGVTTADLFDLTIEVASTGVVLEKHINLTVIDSVRKIDTVLANESSLVRVTTTTAVPANGSNATGVSGADGSDLESTSFIDGSHQANKTGLYALEKADIFNLLCIPPYTDTNNVDVGVISAAISYCQNRRAFYLIDSPADWNSVSDVTNISSSVGATTANAAIFFPRIKSANPLNDNQIEDFAPSGAIAGIFARTDAQRGIWKAPAGLEANILGATGLTASLTEGDIGQLNPKGVNCLRNVPAAGLIIWGARTRKGDDMLASEWKYIPVRRLALHIEESLYRGMQWAVFEPNDEPLWRQINLTVDSFMNTLFRQGAFQGSSPREAYFVKCDKETTTQTDIDNGIVNIVVGFAPLKPAEFVVIKLQQLAGQA